MFSGDSVNSSALTVNMIHVILTGVVTGDVIVASAHSDVDCGAPPPPPQTSVSGEASGIFVDVTGVTIAEVPHVVLPAAGGIAQASILSLSEPASSRPVRRRSRPAARPAPRPPTRRAAHRSSRCRSSGGLITADVITAVSTSTCNGTTASSSAAGSVFANLVVAGVPIAATPPANTMIALPLGIGSVTLNEQISGGDGIDTSSLTVNMIHVVLTARSGDR